ncbi:MATE family efflux transporter [Spiroplasma endosymbiont of Sarcophaga carnaria]|uniref:MATE family efflux transporter n=2 Tax=unclassified Spiroplasma TaxID=2637901 RepID=UPI0030CBBED1
MIQHYCFFKAGLSNFISNFALVVSSYLSTVLVVLLPNQEQYNGVSVLQELLSALNPWITLILSAGIGLTQGARAVIVYNYGAQKYHRIWQVLKITSYLLIIWFCLMLLLVIIFNRQMLLMFAFPSQYVSKYKWWLVLCVYSYLFCVTTFICFTLYQGINKTTLASITTSFCAIFIAIPMICLGYGISIWTNNSIYYFIAMGGIDFIASLCLIPFLCYSWKKYHWQLIDHPDNFVVSSLKIKV